ncbi:Serpentine Receptor, class E (Epsilon) [Caenorhabditis elegans]|nr:Serpentine Receptor, class E (Epsilon) [Caenorhabditis elegans]SAP35553.1 Serpentine Receptor, class E (Epsilon) [Caenorhabditis elegans]|eukprot:NP_001317796.1 Serpentine Receptor, class E (epsilon) [Caenorhabditis elegans]
MHPNFRIINAFYYGQYLIQLSFWVIQPFIILREGLDDSDKFGNSLFTLCSYVRIVGIFYAFCALPALVIERSFATYLLESYEKKPNLCIGTFIVMFQWATAASVGIHFNRASNTVEHTAGAIIANSLAVILNKFNEKLNSKYYYAMDRASYSLSERFQITENIKTAKTFNNIVFSIGFFNTIVNVCLILDNYDIPVTYKNIASVCCDYAILLYGIIVPIVYYIQTESWQKRVAVMMKGCCKPKVVPLKDTFGHDMTSHGACEETTRYFEMLATQWK